MGADDHGNCGDLPLFDRDCAPRLTRRTGGVGANEAHGGGGGVWR